MPTEIFSALLVGDVHLSDRAPRSRLDNYTETVFEKIQEINDFAQLMGASFIIQCGDFFHIKQPSRVSHKIVARAVSVLKNSPVPWMIVPGNHDLPNGNLEQLPRTPLGVLYASGAALLPIPDVVIYPDPYETDYIQIHGTQFTYSLDKDAEHRQAYYPEQKDYPPIFSLTVSHGTLVHFQGTFFGDYTNPKDLDHDRCADVTFNGHLHFGFDDELIEHKGRSLSFVNPGSVMRGSLDEYNREFRPKVKVLKVFDGGRYVIETYFLQSAKPAEEVLDFSTKQQIAEENQRIAEYVETLSKEVSGHDLVGSFDDLVATVRALDISDRVKHKTIVLLEKAYESTI